jgi:hypothetical protein
MAVVKGHFCTSELPIDNVLVLAKHIPSTEKWLFTLK